MRRKNLTFFPEKFKRHTIGKGTRLHYFFPSVEKKCLGLKNEKEGYLCKQVHFDCKTHVITTLAGKKSS